LDDFRGEPRNADMAGVGFSPVLGRIAFTIEGKADESFGSSIESELAKAYDRSNVPKRIEALSNAVLGRASADSGKLRYQLLHGIAATLILAREQQASAAVFIVYSFDTESCTPANMKRNA